MLVKLILTAREIVTCNVSVVSENGIEVKIGESVTGFIRRTDLSRDRAEQRADRFAVGERLMRL